MKFSVNWLREFVDLPKHPEDIAELLTRAGIETKNIETRGASINNVVVSQITASSRHPNADRLTVCEADDGSGTKRQIVCGATNYKVGDKVPLALPGAKLPNGVEIRKSTLRGVESEGMLCSPIELGLGEDASGLLILSPEAKVGAPIADLFPADTILDVEITPNRGDLLSHFGLAREIAALTNKEIVGQAHRLPAGGAPALQRSGVTIAATRESPFFSLRKIDNVKVGLSPQWLRSKIESVGVRSINNIVDISNFVMLELGQPTHAFDADKLSGGIKVRLAGDGEKFLALDGKTYSLKPDNCVIADQERAVGIGGVMGGEETGVTDSTKNILLEAAYFLPASIRRTARDLNLPSDASYRFERGVDPGMVLRASQRAAELIGEIAGGTPAKDIDVAGELPADPADVSLSYEKCSRVIGVAIDPKTVDEILTLFGLRKAAGTNQSATWKIPSYRRDLQRDVDLIEEVLRAYGIEKIPGRTRGRFMPTSTADTSHDVERLLLRNRLTASGLSEVRTSKLISRSAMTSGGAVELRNPLSEDHVALRPNLISGLLDVLERNIRAGAERVSIFEIGRVFIPPVGKEERHLAILLAGNVASAPNWRSETRRTFDMLDLKGVLESIVPNLSLRVEKSADFALAVDICSGDMRIGSGGQLLANKSSAANSVVIAELDVDGLPAVGSAKKFRELDRYPAITRDIAMIVAEKLAHAEILRVIENPSEPLLESVQLFDLFEGVEQTDPTASGKSLAYRLTYRAKNRTLTNEEVTAAHAKIRERLKRELKVTLRE
ncbi:MAG TPA: phenylalanine--tRNA ligase subunit beta [Chthoniobacterales bacterium]|nr:phenylalanine--tRNA ligase subunit beta [Chthoniobacterales bacterium]